MDKQLYIYMTEGLILHSNEKEQTTVTCNNINWSYKLNVEWKKPKKNIYSMIPFIWWLT